MPWSKFKSSYKCLRLPGEAGQKARKPSSWELSSPEAGSHAMSADGLLFPALKEGDRTVTEVCEWAANEHAELDIEASLIGPVKCAVFN